MKELTVQDKSLTTLIESIEDPIKRAFLNNYHKTRAITKTADSMSMSPRTVHYWMVKDPLFAEAFSLLKKELNVQLQEHNESLVKEIADDTATPPQSRLLASFFSLKALDDRYRDRQDSGPQVATQIIIHTSIPEPKYEVTDYEEIDAERTS